MLVHAKNSTPAKYKQSLKSVSTLSYIWAMETNKNIVGDGPTKLEWNHKGFSLNMAREVSLFLETSICQNCVWLC